MLVVGEATEEEMAVADSEYVVCVNAVRVNAVCVDGAGGVGGACAVCVGDVGGVRVVRVCVHMFDRYELYTLG